MEGSSDASFFLLFQHLLMKHQELLLGYPVKTCNACEIPFLSFPVYSRFSALLGKDANDVFESFFHDLA